MSEWLKTVIAGTAGGLLSGGFLLLADYLRHLRAKKERYQELLVEKRVVACGDLMRMLIELDADLSPIQHGIEPLRWPKDSRITPNPSEGQIEHAKRVDKRISELSHYVAANEIILVPEVVKVWHFYYGALTSIRSSVRVRLENDAFAEDALERLLPKFIDETAEAIKRALHGADVEFIPTHEWQALRRDGQEKAKHLIAEAKSRIGGGNQ